MQLIALLLLDRITNSCAVKIKEMLWIISGQHLDSLRIMVTCGKDDWLWGRFASWYQHLQLLRVHERRPHHRLLKTERTIVNHSLNSCVTGTSDLGPEIRDELDQRYPAG